MNIYLLSLLKSAITLDDPLPTPKPILIVSDGEEGDLVEKVIVEQNATSAQPPTPPRSGEAGDITHAEGEDTISSVEKGA